MVGVVNLNKATRGCKPCKQLTTNVLISCVSSERLEKPGIDLTTPDLQGEWLYHNTLEAYEG